MSESEMAEVSFGPCCFCNQQIAESDIDPCTVRVETAGGKWQAWYCHADCFGSGLPNVTTGCSTQHTYNDAH